MYDLKIKVNECFDCPYMALSVGGQTVGCLVKMKKTEMEGKPDWCPLEEVK